MLQRLVALCFTLLLVSQLRASEPSFTLFGAPVINAFSDGDAAVDSLAVGDFNRDGKPDVAVASVCVTASDCSTGGIVVLLGNGDGTFQPNAHYSSGSKDAFSIIVADLNGDGKLDLLVRNDNTIGVLLGNGDGTFRPVVSYQLHGTGLVTVGDFNGDGKLDIAAGASGSAEAGVGVLLGNGDGTFQSAKYYPTDSVQLATGAIGVAVGDFNGDGKIDLAAVEDQCVNFGDPVCENVTVLLGNGDGSFKPPQAYSSGGAGNRGRGNAYGIIAIADVNGDGRPDILVSNVCDNTSPLSQCDQFQAGSVGVLLGNGDGTFQMGKPYTVGGSFLQSLAVADVNGDGKPDVIISNFFQPREKGVVPGSRVAVILGNGDGTFEQPQHYSSIGANLSAVAVADVNGDGRLDLLETQECAGFSDCNWLLQVLPGRKYPSAVAISASGSPIFVDQSVTFTADITSPFGTVPDGETVTFRSGPTSLGSGTTTDGVATLTISALRTTSGIAADYPGDANFKPSSGNTIQFVRHYLTTTTLSSSSNPSTSGQTVLLTATVATSAPVAPSGAVVFKSEDVVIGTAALRSGVAIFRTSPLSTGTFSLTATFVGDVESAASVSLPITQTVN